LQFGDADVVQGSLSPTVTPISGTDANGYQATDPPVWDDPLAYAAGIEVSTFFGSRFAVEFAHPLTCPAPLLVFVARGGSWTHDAYVAQVAYRYSPWPYYGTYHLGFRLARTAP
jgi:hypothetical protein